MDELIRRHEGANWPSVEATEYKNEPGTWMDVTRRVLFDRDTSQFQVRYFEVAPGGYTSLEKHVHEHCVIVVRGRGEVQLGEETFEVGMLDEVTVASGVPHQFRNPSSEPFGIVCIVDRDRDRPVLLGNAKGSTASS